MHEAPSVVEPEQPGTNGAQNDPPKLNLLWVPESAFRSFAQNFAELLVRREGPAYQENGDFWKDVFVERKLPWPRFLQSLAYHGVAIALIWAGSRFMNLQTRVVAEPSVTRETVVYYTPAEYLPPIDTMQPSRGQEKKADPELSSQPIISLPREAEKHSQTVVTPPAIKLRHEVNLPNVVAWQSKPQVPIAPAPVVLASEISRLAPQMEQSVVAPPPDLLHTQASPHDYLRNRQTAVIAPPPEIRQNNSPRIGDLSIAQTTVIAPAPEIRLEAQRVVRTSPALEARAARVVAPPPALGATAASAARQNMIALSLHPAVAAPPQAVEGNRRGSFASTAAGRHGASGSPGNTADGAANKTGSASASAKNSSNLPSGLYVGKTTNTPSNVAHDGPPNLDRYTVNPNLLASARPPRVGRTLQPETESKLADEERAVFGNRRFYSLSLNMPNLNSAGGSWIIRFAAIKDSNLSDSASGAAAFARSEGAPGAVDLSAPSVVRKVDPAYPLELMRQNVRGTVILYAVIHSDGSVGGIRILRSVDQRLDDFASEAIARWKFEPATRNGEPVDVEATFWIPFHPARTGSAF